MNLHIDSPYNINLYKTAANPIVIPESLREKIKALLPKIASAQKFLNKTPKRKSKTAAILEISPEEDIYLHEGWSVQMLVMKKTPQNASLDYWEQEKTLFISTYWVPNYYSIYHEIIHALDPKARPGHEGYIQRDPKTYFMTHPGGYLSVPEEIDAIQSSLVERIINIGKLYKTQDDKSLRDQNAYKKKLDFNQYVNEIQTWLRSPDTTELPYALRTAWGIEKWLKDPKLRKQLLSRIYWALQQLEQLG